MALQAVGFVTAGPELPPWWIGALASENTGSASLRFSVPAHALATFNCCIGARLERGDQALPECFVTGPQRMSQRYCIAPGAALITVFATADALSRLGLGQAHAWVNRFEPMPDAFSSKPSDEAPLAQAEHWLRRLAELPQLAEHAALDASVRVSYGVLHRLHRKGLWDVSERSAQRHLKHAWGISPKWLARMLRLCECAKRWPEIERTSGNLAELAAALGYADQAHMAKDFRALCGTAPSALKADACHQDDDLLWALRLGQNHLLDWLLARAEAKG